MAPNDPPSAIAAVRSAAAEPADGDGEFPSADATVVLSGRIVPAFPSVVDGAPARRGLELTARAAAHVDAADAVNTERAHRSRWARFVEYCETQGIDPDNGLADVHRDDRIVLFTNYADHLAEPTDRNPAGLKPTTAASYLGSARALLRAKNPEISRDEFVAADKAIVGRVKTIAEDDTATSDQRALLDVRKAAAYSRADLKAMVATLDSETARGCQDKAILLLHDGLGGRRSEVARLTVPAITVVFGKGLKVKIRKSKTDQGAKGVTVFVPYARDPAICPVRAVEAWLLRRAELRLPFDGPLFLVIDRHGHIGTAAAGRRTASGRIGDAYPAKVLKTAAKSAELPDADKIAGHSPRRTYITTQVRAGVPSERIAQHTRHSLGSRSFYDYLEEAKDFDDAPPPLG